MEARLQFLGAAQEVTGSRYLLQINGLTILVDCGLHQGRQESKRDWVPFPVPPHSIDVVLLTHAHLDHCGVLPRLVREGFQGRIFCTPATAEITQIVLMDSAKLQEEDAAFKARRHRKEGRTVAHPEIPLYTVADAATVGPLLAPVAYGQPVDLGHDVQATFRDAGHIIGSAMIEVRLDKPGHERTIVFSGDIGRWGRPILSDPTLFAQADYMICESTYGDRVHEDADRELDILSETVNATRQAGGNMLIPSFAIERTQELLYDLNKLLLANRIPHLMVFVDSPMAVSVTRVMTKHQELYNAELRDFVSGNNSPFSFPGLSMVASVDESKAINNIKGTSIIIAGSGMCTGGRIKHHLAQNIARPECTIAFVGYQAVGTLGRLIADGVKEVRILGQKYPVKAKVVQMHGFSAHADRDEIVRWLSGPAKPPRHVFVTHGEPEVAKSFAAYAAEKLHYQTSVPAYRDEVTLD